VKLIPNTPAYVDDRRKRLESTAAALVDARKRLARLDPSTGDNLKSWARSFLAGVRRDMAEAATVPGIGESLERLRAQDQAEAARADPLGALAAALERE